MKRKTYPYRMLLLAVPLIINGNSCTNNGTTLPIAKFNKKDIDDKDALHPQERNVKINDRKTNSGHDAFQIAEDISSNENEQQRTNKSQNLNAIEEQSDKNSKTELEDLRKKKEKIAKPEDLIENERQPLNIQCKKRADQHRQQRTNKNQNLKAVEKNQKNESIADNLKHLRQEQKKISNEIRKTQEAIVTGPFAKIFSQTTYQQILSDRLKELKNKEQEVNNIIIEMLTIAQK